eukprot:TRINITY_DN1879_c0_g1_i1.p1 TRINITY_DN1879_c0_g1~~TRINITY_DN1879_c0_g1_i1.p1  ORF type:complete len:764 (-),score=202.03 TRINITY_DN1879_c0_g1_i1:386-2623(-)
MDEAEVTMPRRKRARVSSAHDASNATTATYALDHSSWLDLREWDDVTQRYVTLSYQEIEALTHSPERNLDGRKFILCCRYCDVDIKKKKYNIVSHENSAKHKSLMELDVVSKGHIPVEQGLEPVSDIAKRRSDRNGLFVLGMALSGAPFEAFDRPAVRTCFEGCGLGRSFASAMHLGRDYLNQLVRMHRESLISDIHGGVFLIVDESDTPHVGTKMYNVLARFLSKTTKHIETVLLSSSVSEEATATAIPVAVLESLKAAGIPHDRVMGISTDNTPQMEMICESLRNEIDQSNPSRPTSLFKTTCCARLVHTVMKSALAVEEFADVYGLVKNIASAFSKSARLSSIYSLHFRNSAMRLESIGSTTPLIPKPILKDRWFSWYDTACVVMDAWELLVPFFQEIEKGEVEYNPKSKKIKKVLSILNAIDPMLLREKLRAVLTSMTPFIGLLEFFHLDEPISVHVYQRIHDFSAVIETRKVDAGKTSHAIEKIGDQHMLIAGEDDEFQHLYDTLVGCAPLEGPTGVAHMTSILKSMAAFWNACHEKWMEVLMSHSLQQFWEGGFWHAMQYFHPQRMAEVGTMEEKEKVKSYMLAAFPLLKEKNLLGELDRYIENCLHMVAEPLLLSWVNSGISPEFAKIVLDVLCFVPSTAAAEVSFTSMGLDGSAASLAPERLEAINLLRANEDYIFNVQMCERVPEAVFRVDGKRMFGHRSSRTRAIIACGTRSIWRDRTQVPADPCEPSTADMLSP